MRRARRGGHGDGDSRVDGDGMDKSATTSHERADARGVPRGGNGVTPRMWYRISWG